MGFYVNPKGESKEAFLEREGKLVEIRNFTEVPKGCMPVVLLDNGYFTAAAVLYNESEFCLALDDMRVRSFYLVPVSKLLKVVVDLEKYVLEKGEIG